MSLNLDRRQRHGCLGAHPDALTLRTVRKFFELCLASQWIFRDPARFVKSKRGRVASDSRFTSAPVGRAEGGGHPIGGSLLYLLPLTYSSIRLTTD